VCVPFDFVRARGQTEGVKGGPATNGIAVGL